MVWAARHSQLQLQRCLLVNDPMQVAAATDPTHAEFWAAAEQRKLTIQRCSSCDHFQFYGRPFCLRCQSDAVRWVAARGTGVIYSQTRVHRTWVPEFTPPYIVALVELDEGVRMLTNIVNGEPAIGERVRVTWRARDGLPPLPVFEPLTAR